MYISSSKTVLVVEFTWLLFEQLEMMLTPVEINFILCKNKI